MTTLNKDGWSQVKSKEPADLVLGSTTSKSLKRTKPTQELSVELGTFISDMSADPLYNNCSANSFTNYFVGNELHGINQALNGKNRFVRIVWYLIVIFILCAAGNSTRKVVSEFFLDQTATSFSIKQVPRLEFPSVIMCPKNPDALKMDQVEKEVRRHISGIKNDTIKRLIGYALADAGFANMGQLVSKMDLKRHNEMTRLLKRWQGNRTTYNFYTNLFERHGYTCEDMFSKCQHGAEHVPCCEMFAQHYVMLRGRCFRLDRMFQTDPDYQGRLYLGMKQLPSPLIEKNGLQPQVIAYIADPGTEMPTFPRYYLNYLAYNYISVTMRKISMLSTSTQCHNADETRGRSACYLRKWLYTRLIDPFNCTLFYMHYRAPWAQICEPGTVARNYKDVSDVTLNSTKCLPSCKRSDRRYTLYTAEPKNGCPRFYEPDIPAFRLEIGYRDLEYEFYKEFVTTTIPGFISEMGGQFGLFAGVTIVTVIQLLLNLVMMAWRSLKKTRELCRLSNLFSLLE